MNLREIYNIIIYGKERIYRGVAIINILAISEMLQSLSIASRIAEAAALDKMAWYDMENIVVNCSALLLLLFLRIQHKSIKNSFLLDQKLFTALLDLAMVMAFVEAGTNSWNYRAIFTAILPNEELGLYIDRSVSMVFNILYFGVCILFGYLWCLYAVHKMYGSPRRVKRYAKIICAPAIFGLLFLLSNPITEWVFYIDENNKYVRGDMLLVPSIVVMSYLFFGVIYINSNRRRLNKYMIMPMTAIITPIFIGVLVTFFVPGTGIIAMVLTISLVGLYASTQSEYAYIDRLSGVYNRRYLDEYLTSLSENKKNKEKGVTITGVMVDMDKFKQINDVYGHHMGDEAISQVGKILRENIGKAGFAARYGGDEFIIITSLLDTDSIEALMQKLTDAANESNASGEHPYELLFSYGYSKFTVGKEDNIDGFMKRMDANMYDYKVAKKARWAKETEEKAKAESELN